jgi:hypothetical protein
MARQEKKINKREREREKKQDTKKREINDMDFK